MTDVERFFRRLVNNLAAVDLRRVRQPTPIAEIYESIVPYRTNRRALELDTSEDYELALMRLCAGDEGFASVSPEEVGVRFEQELASPNPDLSVLYQFGDALVSLSPSRIFSALSGPAPAVAKPQPAPDATPDIAESASMGASDPAAATAMPAVMPATIPTAVPCIACGEPLPDARPANFCPYCGRSQRPPSCSACSLELEPGWRFCPACGQGT